MNKIQKDFFTEYFAKRTVKHVTFDTAIEKNAVNEKIIDALATGVLQKGANETFQKFHKEFCPENNKNIAENVKNCIELSNNKTKIFKQKLSITNI